MRTSRKSLIPLLGAAAVLAGCGSSSKSSSSSSGASSAPATSAATSEASQGVVRAASNSTLGATILVDARGMSLYSLSGERSGKFICTNAACLQAWHPLVAQPGSTPSASVGSLGTVKRPDGAEQVTYKGMPLYTFALDQAPGSARGQGIKDVGTWRAVTAASGTTGAAAPTTSTRATTSTPTTTTTSKSEGGGRSYGY